MVIIFTIAAFLFLVAPTGNNNSNNSYNNNNSYNPPTTTNSEPSSSLRKPINPTTQDFSAKPDQDPTETTLEEDLQELLALDEESVDESEVPPVMPPEPLTTGDFLKEDETLEEEALFASGNFFGDSQGNDNDDNDETSTKVLGTVDVPPSQEEEEEERLEETLTKVIEDIEDAEEEELIKHEATLKKALDKAEDWVKFGLGRLFGTSPNVTEADMETMAETISKRLENEALEEVRTKADALSMKKVEQIEQVASLDESFNMTSKSVRQDVLQAETRAVHDLHEEIGGAFENVEAHLKDKAAQIEVEVVNTVLKDKGKHVSLLLGEIQEDNEANDDDNNDNNKDSPQGKVKSKIDSQPSEAKKEEGIDNNTQKTETESTSTGNDDKKDESGTAAEDATKSEEATKSDNEELPKEAR